VAARILSPELSYQPSFYSLRQFSVQCLDKIHMSKMLTSHYLRPAISSPCRPDSSDVIANSVTLSSFRSISRAVGRTRTRFTHPLVIRNRRAVSRDTPTTTIFRVVIFSLFHMPKDLWHYSRVCTIVPLRKFSRANQFCGNCGRSP
jgi:hypothetical protein